MNTKTKSTLMTEGPIWKRMILFAIPLFLGNLFQQLYNTADSLIVGNFLGSDALAAVSSSGSLIFLMVGFFNGISLGAGVVIARENPCPVELIDPFVGLVHVGKGAVGYVVDRGESGAGKGLGQDGGELLPGERGIHITGKGGDDSLADGIVGVGLVPWTAVGEGAIARQVQLA